MKLFIHLRRLGAMGIVGMLAVLALGGFLPAAAFAAPAKCSATDVHCVITAGDQLIATRQSALDTLRDKVAAELKAEHINSDQANALQADIATNQHDLASLKARLDADTSVTAARQDVKNIFFEFRIFAVVLPRDYQQLHFDIERKLDEKMQGAKAKIQQAIADAHGDKKARLTALYNDYVAHLKTAESQFDTIQTNLPTLTPANFNTTRTTYETHLHAVCSAEKTAHEAMHQAAQDLNQIAHFLK
ncbi:MAG: hypothetical protein M3Z08_04255 [Chloroflexota bacterium]|nr:hypothetical protein [Chloroflexota bacterium]